MNEIPGFKFEEHDAKEITVLLDQCVRLLDQSVGYAQTHCPEDAVLPFKKHIAQIMADLCWDVLEQGFYKKHPSLRPKDSSLV
ncbi:hypothetical protein [Pseudomonas anguilliseptica]|uniref:hypothetical protein n=1 Tax=Pseudomonas anguilliseptica TaxID=53406 RepID=UPI0022B0471E|nr:hypothetical protein [Pseudomonas anguilliseptica]MCZ4323759.1 hypothetical protein [Pseudomonas anguilliseptica]